MRMARDLIYWIECDLGFPSARVNQRHAHENFQHFRLRTSEDFSNRFPSERGPDSMSGGRGSANRRGTRHARHQGRCGKVEDNGGAGRRNLGRPGSRACSPTGPGPPGKAPISDGKTAEVIRLTQAPRPCCPRRAIQLSSAAEGRSGKGRSTSAVPHILRNLNCRMPTGSLPIRRDTKSRKYSGALIMRKGWPPQPRSL